MLCHSMGCLPALDALRPRSAKVRNVLLVAPDVDVDVFAATIRDMGKSKPRIAVFVSQDDQALKLSKSIWGGKARLGDANPDQEPYSGDFKRQGVLVFDLTNLQGDPHSRAFEDVTSVMGMIERRLAAGQELVDSSVTLGAAGQ